jgi:hypothetical protein
MPQVTPSRLGHTEKVQIRREAGLERASWESQPEDFTLRGLTQLLKFLPTLEPEEATARVKVLWEALSDLEARGTAAFYGSYKWSYFHEAKTARFDAVFIRTLNQVAWVPNDDGELVLPGLVVFDTLGWKPNPFLLTKIAFKPPVIDQLAKEAGIDPAALDLLRKLGITNVADLIYRLGITDLPSKPELSTAPDGDVYDGANDLYGDDMPDIPLGTPDPDAGDGSGNGAVRGNKARTGTSTLRSSGQDNGGRPALSGGKGSGSGDGHGKRTPGHSGGRPFISYVGVHPDNNASVPDPDGLDHIERMQIEKQAIDLIIKLEGTLCRTPEGNAGFDLYETDSSGRHIRWVEVKSMTCSLEDRPVGLSYTQFEYARKRGDAYWLYVVEHATDPIRARVLKIQNPVGQSKTFTFDRGWSQIASSQSLKAG